MTISPRAADVFIEKIAPAGRAAPRHAAVALVAVVAALLIGLPADAVTRAQSGTVSPRFSYQVYPQGWNLVAFGGATSLHDEALGRRLFTFQGGDEDYEAADSDQITPGYGYWVYAPAAIALSADYPSFFTYSVPVAAGRCVMVGNPSMQASAAVRGAQSVFEFSPALNAYLQTTTIGAGRGAWACNESRGSTVTVTAGVPLVQKFVAPIASTVSPGRVRLTLVNISHSPVVFGIRQMDAGGNPSSDMLAYGSDTIPGCDTCPEQIDRKSAAEICITTMAARRLTVLPPGAYLLHVQYEQPAVPDLIATFTAAPNTAYVACYL